MRTHTSTIEVAGPWSPAASLGFWEGFTPAALIGQGGVGLRTVFRVDTDWSRAEMEVVQHAQSPTITVTGDENLDAATAQVCRFLSLDVDGSGWPDVARHGDDGAFPAPATLADPDLDLPGRKGEYLHAVAEAALDGRLDGAALRAVDPDEATRSVQEVKGLGPFASELVVIRGANAPEALPRHERRLEAEITARYGSDDLADISAAWRPYRTWASVDLRATAA